MGRDPRDQARRLADGLGKALGERLRGAVLFGSVARGEAVPGVSDINVLVLIEGLDASAIRAASPLARDWAGHGNTPPLVLDWHEVPNSTDAFAVELSDMIDVHEVLVGDDPLEGLVVGQRDLRLQAERELRGKLVQLREGLLLAAPEPKQIGRLLLTAIPSFLTYHRALLRLAGRGVPTHGEAVVEQAAALVGHAPDSFLRALEARRSGERLRLDLDHPVVAGYYSLAEHTAAYVDALPENDT